MGFREEPPGRLLRAENVETAAIGIEEFSELKIPYDTVEAADFADLECEASAKSCPSA